MAAPEKPPPIYAAALESYWQLGWPGILPLPPKQKASPPEGLTGWEGDWPSYADMYAWAEERPSANIALRMPPNVLGIDVDNYKEKHGGHTLAEHEIEWGPLPATWRSTSRDDGISGIRFYSVPPGLGWIGGLPSIELIHFGHRYAVVAPSIHPEGRPYRWIDPDGNTSLTNPSAFDMPLLPAAWLLGLSVGQHAFEARADLDDAGVSAWLAALSDSSKTTCEFLSKFTAEAVRMMGESHESRHDITRDRVLALVRKGANGHPGLLAALDRVRAAFIRLVIGDNSRTMREASSEWGRILAGAVRIVAANPHPPVVPGDPCGPVMAKVGSQPRPTASEPRLDAVALLLAGQTAPMEQPRPTASEPRPDAVEESSWTPVDLGPIIRNEVVEQGPTVLARVDGVRLLYPGKVNGIIGPSESAKTWLALEAAAQTIAARLHVVYLDFEDYALSIITKCRRLGIPDDDILSHLHYVNPEDTFDERANAALEQTLERYKPALIVLDGVNAAMTLMGLDLMSNKDATVFSQKILKPLARKDWEPCVTYVDHTPKNNPESAGGIGAQAKRAMTTGCTLKVEVLTPFGDGQPGRIKIIVDKDRGGKVRGASVLIGGVHVVGVAHIDTDGITGVISLDIHSEARSVDSQGHFRPTNLMQKVCEWLELHPDENTQNAIISGVAKNAQGTREAISALIREGYVRRDLVGQRHKHILVRMFRESDSSDTSTSAASAHVRPDQQIGLEEPRPTASEHTSERWFGPDAVQGISEDQQLGNRVRPSEALEAPEVPSGHRYVGGGIAVDEEGDFYRIDTGEKLTQRQTDQTLGEGDQ